MIEEEEKVEINPKLAKACGFKHTDNAENVKFTSKAAGLAAMGFTAAEASIKAATPLLAISGVGIPLAAALFVVSRFADQVKHDRELSAIANESMTVFSFFIRLHKLIVENISVYHTKMSDIADNIENPDKKKNFMEKKSNYVMDKKIIDKIIVKTEEFTKLLVSVTPEDKKSSMFSRMSKQANIFMMAKKYRREIVEELTVLNAYVMIYHAKFALVKKYYNRLIKKHFDNSGEIIDDIEEKIEISDAYKNYMIPENDTGVKNLKKYVDQDDCTHELIENNITKLKEEGKGEIKTNGGKRTSKTHKNKRKQNKTRKHKA
jgi:hypothetical protein